MNIQDRFNGRQTVLGNFWERVTNGRRRLNVLASFAEFKHPGSWLGQRKNSVARLNNSDESMLIVSMIIILGHHRNYLSVLFLRLRIRRPGSFGADHWQDILTWVSCPFSPRSDKGCWARHGWVPFYTFWNHHRLHMLYLHFQPIAQKCRPTKLHIPYQHCKAIDQKCRLTKLRWAV